jgi:hypothetical protein
MSPDLNALRRLVHTPNDARLFDILSKIYNFDRRTPQRRRACGELYIFLSNLPEFRAGLKKYGDFSEAETPEDENADEKSGNLQSKKPQKTPIKSPGKCYLADEANKSADVLENLWLWLFDEGKDGIPQIEKFSVEKIKPENIGKGLFNNMLYWMRYKRGCLRGQNNKDYYKQSQVLPGDAPKIIGDNEVGTFLQSFEATPTASWRRFLDVCYDDRDDSLKQPVSQRYPTFTCHLYLMLVEFRQPRPKNVEQVQEALEREHSLIIPTDTIGRLARENFVPLLKQKYQDFLDNDGELITN